MNELRACNNFIFSRLDANPTIQGLVTGPNGRIYPGLAPEDAEFPHIIYNCQSSSQSVAVGAGESIQAAARYQIKAVTMGEENLDTAHQIADAIDAVLSIAFGTINIGGGNFYIGRVVKENIINLMEVNDGVRYDYVGGIYRLTVCRV